MQLLGIDLRQISVGQQHVWILPSSSLFASSRMANACECAARRVDTFYTPHRASLHSLVRQPAGMVQYSAWFFRSRLNARTMAAG